MADNVHIIKGLDALINPENIRPEMSSDDLRNLEKSMVEGGLVLQKIKDPQDKFEEELQLAAEKLGISFGKPVEKKPTIDFLAEETQDTEPDFPAEEPVQETTYSSPPQNPYTPAPKNRFETDDRPRFTDNNLSGYTQEEHRRSHIDAVIGSGDVDALIENEKNADRKSAMLSEIDILLSALNEEDIDLSRIQQVDQNSDFNTVKTVLKMLRDKNDHSRFCAFAEEGIVFVACALGEIFNGERVFFNRWTPDMRGWHYHVSAKLKRMRVDTGQIVSTLMSEWNVSPFMRIAMELIPNGLLYSYKKSQQYSEPNLNIDTQNTADDIGSI